MTTIYSQNINGKLTHWVHKDYKKLILIKKIFSLLKHQMGNKPKGLLLMWNGDWKCFCKSDFITWMEDKICLLAKLKPDLKLWLIDSFESFNIVWKQYTDKPAYDFLKVDKKFWKWLEWQGYDGVAQTIEWSTGYGWDCASIVIFNPKNVILKGKMTNKEIKGEF